MNFMVGNYTPMSPFTVYPLTEPCSDSCIKSKNNSKENINNISFQTIPPKILSFLLQINDIFELDSCLAHLSIKYRHRFNISCQDIYKFMKTNSIKQKIIIYKSTPRPSEITRFQKEIYRGCNHLGSCNTSECICHTNETYCEVFCMCQSCNNIKKCNCKVCDKNCPCRMCYRECTVLCHSSCVNMEIQKNLTKKVEIRDSFKSGYGLFAGEDIPAQKFVIEYTGEVLGAIDSEVRGYFYDQKKISYLFNLSSDDSLHTLDATRISNESRFINHGEKKDENLTAIPMVVNGIKKMVFYSTRAIKKGEELLFNYNYDQCTKKNFNIVN